MKSIQYIATATLVLLTFGSMAQTSFASGDFLTQTAVITKLKEGKGGQVIESQGYHLEFVPKKTEKGLHLDFYLQKSDNHATVGGAKVTAQVQMPNGKKEALTLKYDAKKKHYTALLAVKATGDYKVAILCDIAGKKVNGRFSFKR